MAQNKLVTFFLLGFLVILVLFAFYWEDFFPSSSSSSPALSSLEYGSVNADIAMLHHLRRTYPQLAMRLPYLLGRSPAPRPDRIADASSSASGSSSGKKLLPPRADDGKFYGGIGDATHLGGWTDFDPHGVSNMTWDYMIGILGVKSFLDIGCGRGYSTRYFYERGVRVLCIEGSSAAIQRSHLPVKEHPELVVEHDYALGAYWPEQTFDACWSVEFLEHVSRQYFKNYINSFRQCALIFVTASRNGGYHHVSLPSSAAVVLPIRSANRSSSSYRWKSMDMSGGREGS
jgi:SAM-dependent methyltransferase